MKCSGLKTRRTALADNLYHASEQSRLYLDSKFYRIPGIQPAAAGRRHVLQHAVRESAPERVSFPPSFDYLGFVAPEHLSPRRCMVPGTRNEGNTTRTLFHTIIGGLCFRGRLFLLAACVALVHQRLSLSDGHFPRPRRDKLWLLNIAAATY